jgi:F-type H+-transporting ATPase subunit delta
LAEVDLAAKRYALAAFALAKDHGDTQQWVAALEAIGAFMGRPDIKPMLQNTRVSQDAKMRLVDAGLNDQPELPLNMAKLLVRKNRTALAQDIATEFKAQVEAEAGVARATARTAVPLSTLEQEGLARKVEQFLGQRVVLAVEVDPSLIGGVVVQVGDRLIDASVRTRLESLRETLVGGR